MSQSNIVYGIALLVKKSSVDVDSEQLDCVQEHFRLLTSHCHCVTFAYPRDREGSIDAISTSRAYTPPPRCIIDLVHIS